MMFLDLLGMLPFDPPGSASRQRPPGENLTGALSLTIFPGVDFVVVLLGDMEMSLTVPLVIVPVAFAAASVLLTRLLRTRAIWTVGMALGCAAMCLLASGFALLLSAFTSFYSGF
jgi:hypothetical protein